MVGLNVGHHSGRSNESSGVEMRIGIKYEKAMPAKIPVTIDAAPNMAAVEEYSGATVLR